MPIIKIRDNESFEVFIRRFKRACEKAGILAEVRKREFYEKPTTRRKKAKLLAIKRHIKKNSKNNINKLNRINKHVYIKNDL